MDLKLFVKCEVIDGFVLLQILAIGTEDGRPLKLVVHPSGAGVLCAFANSFK